MSQQDPDSKHPSSYEVGRGKPPTHTRWKPKQSGNPAGRKRGSLNKKTYDKILSAVLIEGTVEVNERGRGRQVSKLEALVLKLLNMALLGDRRAIKDLLDIVERQCKDQPTSAEHHETADEDAEILGRFGLSRSRSDAGGIVAGEGHLSEDPGDGVEQ